MAVYPKYGNTEQAVAVTWTSDGSGDAEVDLGWLYCGTYHSFISIPGTGVSDNFDITVSASIKLADGVTAVLSDVLSGGGANLSNSSNGESKPLATQCTVAFEHQLTLYVSNAGDTKSGVLILNVWEESN